MACSALKAAWDDFLTLEFGLGRYCASSSKMLADIKQAEDRNVLARSAPAFHREKSTPRGAAGLRESKNTWSRAGPNP